MIAKTGEIPARHIPTRTCILCRKTDSKRSLIRLVRTADKRIEVDSTGKKSGRGAYLCPDTKCWEQALRTGRLEQNLKTSLSLESREKLAVYAQKLESFKP
ncbi:MAG TPA: YlxR family protein [Dehalococcoidales bacterium]|nr:YlxR family protein [Dehalococcoidales bacterium]